MAALLSAQQRLVAASSTAPKQQSCSRRGVAMVVCSARQRQGEQAAAAPEQTSRRAVVLSAAAALLAAAAASARAAAPVPPAPRLGDCPECIGEINETLNACSLQSSSCISTLNDDADHFEAPWGFDGDREAAIAQLLAVATGGDYDPGLINTFGGVRQIDAAKYIVGGVLAVATGGDLPEQPKRQRKDAKDFVPFDGTVVERKTTPGGAEYVRIVLGTDRGQAAQVDNPAAVIDAEFLFLAGDSIVNVRAASRVEPEGRLGSGGQLALSFTEGLVIDKNLARRQMESLRTALRWESVPVIADFDPRFNAEAPTVVEKLFDPFNRRNFQPSGIPYPADPTYPDPESSRPLRALQP